MYDKIKHFYTKDDKVSLRIVSPNIRMDWQKRERMDCEIRINSILRKRAA